MVYTKISMKKLILSSLALLLSSNAYAEDSTAQEIEALKLRIEALEKQAENDVDITLNPAPRFTSKDGNMSFGIHGFIQGDMAFFDDDKVDHPDGTKIRRTYIGVDGTYEQDWHYKITADISSDNAKIVNAFVRYSGVDRWNFIAGHFKEHFGMEAMTGASDVILMERSLPSAAFTPMFKMGMAAKTKGDDWAFATGIFRNRGPAADTEDELYAFTNRVGYAPVMEGDRIVHLGAAVRYMVANGNESISFKSFPENNVTDTRLVDTGSISDVDDVLQTGVEFAASHGPALLQAEYISTRVTRDNNMRDVDFEGYYVQASYFLTGEQRPYDVANGKFKGVTPQKSLSRDSDGYGAVELAVRYSSLDLTDGPVSGGEGEAVTAGINWYLNKNIRLGVNYTAAEREKASINDSPEVIGMRIQVKL